MASRTIDEKEPGQDRLKDGVDANTPILRLREFVKWAQKEGLCTCEYDFERQCKLSAKYISNNIANGKGNMGSKMLGLIAHVYPQLNLAWICNGEGPMLNICNNDFNADYKQAYQGAMLQIEALNRILKKKG